MSTTINDLIRVLGSILGYELEKSGDHVRYVLRVNGRIIARTKFSHSWRGNQQISEPILHAIAKQMHCSTKTLKLLLQGRLERETYFRELLDGKVLEQSEFDILLGRANKNPDTKRKRTKDS